MMIRERETERKREGEEGREIIKQQKQTKKQTFIHKASFYYIKTVKLDSKSIRKGVPPLGGKTPQ